jgi:hypothetical protein
LKPQGNPAEAASGGFPLSTLLGANMSAIQIPVDDSGEPLVTDEMKAECLGEFKWEEDWPYYDENGKFHEDHVHTHTVPWSVCKEIYKRMAKAAATGSVAA